MSYITYSHHPNIIYEELLDAMSKRERTLIVVEVRPNDPFSSIYYELHDESYPEGVADRFAEMTVKPIEMFGKRTTLAGIRQINKIMRRIDDSGAYPIQDEFNATERAIRKIRRLSATGCGPDCNWSYWQTLKKEISDIVNKEI